MGDGGDDLDVAAELQQTLNDAGVAKIRERMAPESDPDFDGKHCIQCADEIPKVRLKMKRIRCVPCQEAKEKKERR